MAAADYLSLTKPKIALLNVFTAAAAFVASTAELSRLPFLIVVGFLAAGGAAAVNNYVDRDIDIRMSRTSIRPIPRGRIRPAWKGAVFGIALIVASLALSAFKLNLLATFFVFSGAFIYVVIYSMWLKRKTPWNIVIGGAAGSCSPLAGGAAATGSVEALPVLVALLVFLWTPGHFWALAIRGEEEYRKAGLPMLPNVVGVRRASRIAGLSNLAMLPSWAAIALFVPHAPTYLVITTPMTLLLCYHSLRLIMQAEGTSAWRAFRVSSPWLAAVMIGMMLALSPFPP